MRNEDFYVTDFDFKAKSRIWTKTKNENLTIYSTSLCLFLFILVVIRIPTIIIYHILILFLRIPIECCQYPLLKKRRNLVRQQYYCSISCTCYSISIKKIIYSINAKCNKIIGYKIQKLYSFFLLSFGRQIKSDISFD